MKPEQKHITITDWIVFFVSTFLIFISSILLVISGAIFTLFRLARRRPVLAVASLLGIVILYGVIQWMVIPVAWRADGQSVHVTIEQGDSMTRIVQRLNEAKVIEDGTALLILTKLSGKDREIQAGRYSFEKGTTLYSIFHKLIRGDVTLREVTIPEGLTMRQIAGVLNRQIEIDSLEFVRLATDRRFAQSMGI
ncbi:MAG: endolytic transglycosylase MltG, partial [Candidatus Zixiibacteriota bacterium]